MLQLLLQWYGLVSSLQPTSGKQATEIREKEKAENTVTISDAQEAQTAVSQAVTVLKESAFGIDKSSVV